MTNIEQARAIYIAYLGQISRERGASEANDEFIESVLSGVEDNSHGVKLALFVLEYE